MDLHQWIEARIAALPEETFDHLDDWPENAEDFDDSLPDTFRTALEPTLISMEYRDAQGEVSDRKVTLLQMQGSSEGPVHLIGKCHMRNARRTFRFDRILAIHGLPGLSRNPTPQDVLTALADLSLGAHPQAKPPYETGKKPRTRWPTPEQTTPETADIASTAEPQPARERPEAAAFRAVRQKHRAELRLLCFLAKADRQLHPGEIDAMDRYARSLAGLMAGAKWTEADSAALAAYLRNLKFSAEAERACLEQIGWLGDEAATRFGDAAGEVMEADGRIDPAEAEMILSWGVTPENIGVRPDMESELKGEPARERNKARSTNAATLFLLSSLIFIAAMIAMYVIRR